jgi:hypothetical protein
MNFFTYLRSTYQYEDKSWFMSFAEGLLLPYRVYARAQTIQVAGKSDKPEQVLLYKPTKYGVLAHIVALPFLPFSFLLGSLVKGLTLLSSGVRARNDSAASKIEEHKTEIQKLKQSLKDQFAEREKWSEREIEQKRQEWAPYSEARRRLTAEMEAEYVEQTKAAQAEIDSFGMSSKDGLSHSQIQARFAELREPLLDAAQGIRQAHSGKIQIVQNQSVKFTNVLLARLNTNLKRKHVDTTRPEGLLQAAKRLTSQHGDPQDSSDKETYAFMFNHDSSFAVYEEYRGNMSADQQERLYTLGTEEYKQRVTHNTFAKYGFHSMYGAERAKAYSEALRRADNRFFDQTKIDSSAIHDFKPFGN